MAYTNPTTMVAGQVFTASRWNTQVKDNFDMLASLANDGTLKWDNTNKRLGVGTTTPATKLHVYSAGDSTLTIETASAAQYAYFLLKTASRRYQIATAGASVGNATAGNFYIYDETAAASRFTITSTGATLIGKQSGLTGAGDLDVAGATNLSGALTVAGNLGFYGGAANGKQTVTGSRGGNAALQSLLIGLSNIGLITNSSSA